MNGSTLNRSASAVLGTAVILLGLQRRGSTRVLSLATGAGLLTYGALARSPSGPTQSVIPSSGAISRVITVGKPREKLYRMWCDPQVLSELLGGAIQVSGEGEGRVRMQMSIPGLHNVTWTSRLVEQDRGSSLVWRTDPGATTPHELFIRLRDARPIECGTEVTLGISPVSNALWTKAFLRLTHSVDKAMLTKVLRRFKSLVETGEMPTLSHNPAARNRAIAAV